MRKVNICILGCGSVARLHSRIAKTLRKQLAFSYASRDMQKAQEYNRKFKGAGAFGSYEAACAASDVDAVFICTPHAYHLDNARLAASHGKPMLIEKPVTRTLEELAEMRKAVEGADVACMVAENYFFKPLVIGLRKRLENKDIGTLLCIELNRANKSRPSGWRADAELMGGGALLEGGVHWINLLCSIGGAVTEVLAIRPTCAYEMTAPFEDTLELLFKFEDGTIGKMLHSWNVTNRIGGLGLSKLIGTDGNIHFESNGVIGLLLGRKMRLLFPGLLDLMGYRAMLAHFADIVRDGGVPSMSLDVAHRDMAIVDAAYRSLESGRFEAVPAA